MINYIDKQVLLWRIWANACTAQNLLLKNKSICSLYALCKITFYIIIKKIKLINPFSPIGINISRKQFCAANKVICSSDGEDNILIKNVF